MNSAFFYSRVFKFPCFKILRVLAPYVKSFTGQLNVQNVAGALQGLQKMRSGMWVCVCERVKEREGVCVYVGVIECVCM